jgi:phage shock protein PspC (stress-responsive transcriptional regulator)
MSAKNGGNIDAPAFGTTFASYLASTRMELVMQDIDNMKTPLPLRSDTILGVCQAIGEDFGFNPNFLRITLCVLVIWSPMVSFAIYFGLGLLVAASRLLFPDGHSTSAPSVTEHGPAANSDESVKVAA